MAKDKPAQDKRFNKKRTMGRSVEAKGKPAPDPRHRTVTKPPERGAEEEATPAKPPAEAATS